MNRPLSTPEDTDRAQQGDRELESGLGLQSSMAGPGLPVRPPNSAVCTAFWKCPPSIRSEVNTMFVRLEKEREFLYFIKSSV